MAKQKLFSKEFYGTSFSKRVLTFIVCSVLLFSGIFVIVYFALYYLDVNILWVDDMPVGNLMWLSFLEHKMEITLLSIGATYYLMFYCSTFFFSRKPATTDVLASQRFLSNDEQLKSDLFYKVPLREPVKIDKGGMIVNNFGEKIIYDTEYFHSIILGTTTSGKTRKVAMPSLYLMISAGDHIIVNDPKKELYFKFRDKLEKENYRTVLYDFDHLEYSEGVNPFDDIINFLENDDIDNADEYANDITFALVNDDGKGEKIWVDGQKALIKACILAVCMADIEIEKKNLFSVYMMISVLGKFVTVGKQQKPLLSLYFESLPETDVSRIAYTTISNAPEKTSQSFFAAALATISLFSSKKLSKTLSKSTFDPNEFKDGKVAIFIVTPDDKPAYHPVSTLIINQLYRKLCSIAKAEENGKLKRTVHIVLEEAGNMAPLSKMDSKITLSRSLGILFHLFLQDYNQTYVLYGKEVGQTIISNCNRNYFISSADFDTCKSVSESIGEFTEQVSSVSNSFDRVGNITSTSISHNQQKRPLIDPNELKSYDNRKGDRCIFQRSHCLPIIANLPDISTYDWDKELIPNKKEVIADMNLTLKYAIPRHIYFQNDSFFSRLVDDPMWNGFVWYYSMDGKLENEVKKFIENNYKSNMDINEFCKSKEFIDYISSIDLNDEKQELLPKENKTNETARKIYKWIINIGGNIDDLDA